MFCEGYEPFYYYITPSVSEEKKSGLLPNWLITDNIAIGINFQTSKGIIIRDTQQRKKMFQLLIWCFMYDLNEIM